MDEELNIGSSIRHLRELKKLTPQEVASGLNMSLSGYRKIERNETDLTLKRVYEIAKILEVEISQILNFKASHIFNITNNKSQGSGYIENQENHSDVAPYQKMIAHLEEEIVFLRGQLSK